MSISITIRHTKGEKLVAFASAVINDTFTVTGIKVFRNVDGLNVQMPGYSNTAKTGRTYFNPHFKYTGKLNQAEFEEAVIKAFNEAKSSINYKSIDTPVAA